jgi:hypothetical protein
VTVQVKGRGITRGYSAGLPAGDPLPEDCDFRWSGPFSGIANRPITRERYGIATRLAHVSAAQCA